MEKDQDALIEAAVGSKDPRARAAAQNEFIRSWSGGRSGFADLVERFVVGLGSRDERKRQSAFMGLLGFGEMAAPFLLPLLCHEDPKVRKSARMVMETIESQQEEMKRGIEIVRK